MLTSPSSPKLTAHNLKQIATISMLIDHIAAIILCNFILTPSTLTGAVISPKPIAEVLLSQKAALKVLHAAMRAFGRLAFPLYCFLLVEGFHHTRSKQKYIQRLLLFALISEIPYDLAFSGEWFHPARNNVFLTLSLGFLMMWAISTTQKQTRNLEPIMKNVLRNTISIFICCLTIVLSTGFHTDYECSGIIAIWILFTLRSHPVTAMFLATLSMSILIGDSIQRASLFSIIPIALYNGQKGISGNRYLFYIFYPAHLLILTAATYLIPIP